jgi:hypothetical protein
MQLYFWNHTTTKSKRKDCMDFPNHALFMKNEGHLDRQLF